MRINDELLFANPEIDDASSENIIHFKQDGTRISEKFDDQLEAFIKYLVN